MAYASTFAMERMAYLAGRLDTRLGMRLERGEGREGWNWSAGAYRMAQTGRLARGLVCIGLRGRIRYGMDSLSGGVGYAIGYASGKGRGESKPVLVYRGISLMGQIGRLTRGCWMALACAGASAMERIAYPAGRSGARLDMRLERGEGKASGIRLCGFA